jgi:DNA (cytosine-5)-methyltransferase 1
LWWNVPVPPQRNVGFADLIEENPTSVPWHSASETKQLLAKMSPLNLLKLEQAKRIGRRVVGCVYKRTRLNENGVKVQRALTMSLDACELRREVPAAR